jgi:hypothetical protein
MGARTGLIWLWIENSSMVSWKRQYIWGVYKMTGISRVAEELLASQEELANFRDWG